MTNGEPPQDSRAKRLQLAKIALIPVLGFVLYGQIMGGLDEAATALSATENGAGAAAAVVPAAENDPQPPAPILASTREVSEILAENPFTRPPELQPAPPDPVLELLSAPADEGEGEDDLAEGEESQENEWERVRTKWETQRVNIVLRAGSDLVAVIGDRTVRVGDVLDERVRVVEIRPDSVVLEEISPKVDEETPLP